MEALECILTRRSIRQFNGKIIPDNTIKEILNAAVSAPSAGNQQSWQFIVVNERTILDDIPNYHPHAKMLEQASTAIVVCGDTSNEKHPGFWVLDCSAAIQNILLSSHALDIASVWLGVYPNMERVNNLKKLIKLPDYIIPHSIVALGYSDLKGSRVERLNQQIIHYNKW